MCITKEEGTSTSKVLSSHHSLTFAFLLHKRHKLLVTHPRILLTVIKSVFIFDVDQVVGHVPKMRYNAWLDADR